MKEFIQQQIREYKLSSIGKHITHSHKQEFLKIKYLTSFLSENCSISERLYCIMYDIKEKVLCPNCKSKSPKYRNISLGYLKYCSYACMNTDTEQIQKRENAILKKFGVKNAFQSEECKQKIKKTNLKKYGVENPSSSKEIHKKKEQTTLKNYGVTNPSFSKTVVDKIVDSQIKNGSLIYTRYYHNIGTNEEKLLDSLEQLDNCKIDRNFRALIYYPDGYCHETNTIYEIYESHHDRPKYIEKDKKRQKHIQDNLECTFVILKEKTGELIRIPPKIQNSF